MDVKAAHNTGNKTHTIRITISEKEWDAFSEKTLKKNKTVCDEVKNYFETKTEK
jgi:hypothetical protein